MITFVALNFLVFSTWFLLADALPAGAGARRSRGESLALAGLLGTAQIVLTLTVLGVGGWLRRDPVLITTLLASHGVMATGFAFRRRRARLGLPAPLPLRSALAEAMGPVNAVLLALAAFALLWLAVAAWLLPPRGIDDVTYHLPAMVEALRARGFPFLWPLVVMRGQFAMPVGGDLLVLWQLLFLHRDTFVDFVQVPAALYVGVATYAIARRLGVARRDALFAGLLFLFVPAVLGQAGSSYVDVTVTAVQAGLLLAATLFWQDGRFRDLALTGIAAGLALATKYNLLVPVVALQPLLLLRLWRSSPLRLARDYAAFLLIAGLLPAFWFYRNAVVTGFPFFPYRLTASGLEAMAQTVTDGAAAAAPAGAGRALGALLAEPLRFLGLLLQDPGFGSLNGGLGLMFWAFALPALVVCAVRAVRPALAGDLLPLTLWGQALLVILAVLVQIDVDRLRFNLRLALPAVPFALVALALLQDRLRQAASGSAGVIAGAGLASSVLALVALAGFQLPTFVLKDAVADRIAGRATSPYRYYRSNGNDLQALGSAWDPLEYLTAGTSGWSVHMLAPWPVMILGPAYGTGLQNHLWNLDWWGAEPRPDAAIVHYGSDPGLAFYQLGRALPPAELRRDPGWVVVNETPTTELWVRAERLAEPDTRARLMEYYRRRYPDEIDAARAALPALPAGVPIVTATSLGHALRYLELAGELGSAVHLVHPGEERATALRLGLPVVLTLGAALPGGQSEPAGTIDAPGGAVPVYRVEVAL